MYLPDVNGLMKLSSLCSAAACEKVVSDLGLGSVSHRVLPFPPPHKTC